MENQQENTPERESGTPFFIGRAFGLAGDTKGLNDYMTSIESVTIHLQKKWEEVVTAIRTEIGLLKTEFSQISERIIAEDDKIEERVIKIITDLKEMRQGQPQNAQPQNGQPQTEQSQNGQTQNDQAYTQMVDELYGVRLEKLRANGKIPATAADTFNTKASGIFDQLSALENKLDTAMDSYRATLKSKQAEYEEVARGYEYGRAIVTTGNEISTFG